MSDAAKTASIKLAAHMKENLQNSINNSQLYVRKQASITGHLQNAHLWELKSL